MPRNLVERCEVVFPVQDAALAKRLREEILGAYLADNVKARMLQPSGEYVRVAPMAHGGARFSAQDYLMGVAMGVGVKVPATKTHEPKVHVAAEKVVAAKVEVNGAGKSAGAKV